MKIFDEVALTISGLLGRKKFKAGQIVRMKSFLPKEYSRGGYHYFKIVEVNDADEMKAIFYKLQGPSEFVLSKSCNIEITDMDETQFKLIMDDLK